MILLWILFTYYEARYNGNLINNGYWINHNHQTWRRIGAAIPCFILEYVIFQNIWLSVALIPLMATSFWLIFDFVINYTRKLGSLYIGHTSIIDKYFRKTFDYPELIMILVKILLLSLSVMFYGRNF